MAMSVMEDARPEERPAVHGGRLFAAYVALLIGAGLLTFAVCWLGHTWYGPAIPQEVEAATAGAVAESAAKPLSAAASLPHLLPSLLCIMLLGRLLGGLLKLWKQPPVIGEIIAGIMLGPSLLGRVWPEAQLLLMPPEAVPYLELTAQFGVIAYLFLVGLEFESQSIHDQGGQAVAVSHASMLVPFVCGSLLALVLYPIVGERHVSFPVFALFLGLAMSVTAFPVLASILTDLNITRTKLGATALCCAAADDVTAWCLLALVAGLAQDSWQSSVYVLGGTIVYLAVMWLAIRPVLRGWLEKFEASGRHDSALVLVLAGLLASAATAEWIGIHALFGAFFLGAIVPSQSRVALSLRAKLETLVRVLLLPAFFAAVGLKTQIGLVSGWWAWGLCLAVIAVAIFGKFGGSYGAARLTGMPARQAAALGWLMNTRGLMELVVLSIGLQLGVISPTLFAMLVVMALVTTWMTCPALAWFDLLPKEQDEETQPQATKAVVG